MSTQDRELARRAFARELEDATHDFEGDEGKNPPQFVLLPTGVRANRLFIIGRLVDVEDIGNDTEYWQARIEDSAGDSFFAYAGPQYQQQATNYLRSVSPNTYVAAVAKPDVYQTDNGDHNVSLRPERLVTVDEQARHRWTTEAAESTFDRIDAFYNNSSPDIDKAREIYGTSLESYRDAAMTALRNLQQPDPK